MYDRVKVAQEERTKKTKQAKAESRLKELLPSLLISVKKMRDEIKELLDIAKSGTHEPILGLKWLLREEILQHLLIDLNTMLEPFEE